MIDLRSDTVTKPTEEMREAMYKAEVGDSIYGDDPTVNELERYAARLVGKETAVFVPSGVFGNQLSLFTHCQKGDEVIVGDDAHIVSHEGGASAVIAGVQLRTLNTEKGEMRLQEIQAKIRMDSYPKTALICLENAYSNGRVVPLSYMNEVYHIAKEYKIAVHLDGARLFNAATYLNVDPKEITANCDSVMFCLSKGLCAPIGSIVAGSEDFIEKSRIKKRIMGGGLRQAGVLAAPGLIALKKMIARLEDDHKSAKYLANKLSDIKEIEVYEDDVHINMVFFRLLKKVNPEHMYNYFLEHNIKINPPENNILRFVTHYRITNKDIDEVVSVLKDFLK